MRILTRALSAALLSITLGACSIGEGNGIVSIEIVEFDGTSDFEIRADQCEGTLLSVLATFTDGQRTVYTHRANWSAVGNATLIELKNSLDFTTAVDIVPASASPGDIITVTATYLGLSTSKDITVNSTTINSFQLEPSVIALISGETQTISSVLSLSDGSRVLNPVRGLTFSVPDGDTAFTAVGFNSSGQAILETTDTASSGSPIQATQASVSFSCNRDDGSNPIATATASAINYATNSSDISLEISSNFDGKGDTAADATARQLPNDTLVRASSSLKFASSNISRPITNATWTASNGTDCTVAGANCSATVSSGFITTDDTTTGETEISASYQIDDNNTVSTTTPLKINVSPLLYADPPLVLKDESQQVIDTSPAAAPAVTLASNSGRILQMVGQLIDGATNPYELVVTPTFSRTDADSDNMTAFATTLVGLGDTAKNVTISVDTTTVLGGNTLPAAFTNNIENFVAAVHIDAATGLFIDSNGDGTADTTATVAVNDQIALRSFLTFAGKDSILRTGATSWSTSNNALAVVNNINNVGVVTVLDNSQAVTITATHVFTDHNGDSSTQTATFTIN